jgi:hypothetical protein
MEQQRLYADERKKEKFRDFFGDSLSDLDKEVQSGIESVLAEQAEKKSKAKEALLRDVNRRSSLRLRPTPESSGSGAASSSSQVASSNVEVNIENEDKDSQEENGSNFSDGMCKPMVVSISLRIEKLRA